tara:strand:- start:5330 stop:5665 length:336 start_codon:yes stop_codon:yes gene_type:complete
MTPPKWVLRLWSKIAPRRMLIVVESDTPPDLLPTRNLYLAREDEEDWAIALNCPCGCGDRLELLLVPEAKPRWTVISPDGAPPSLHPSVWRQSGCGAHFWIRDGRVHWCKD